MKPEIKSQLVNALRSGEYKQTQGRLRNSHNEFCVLGVLCNLHAQAHPRTAAQQKDATLYMGNFASLPTAVAKWAGLKDCDSNFGPDIVIDRMTLDLTGHNDQGISFRRLANAIEKQL
jgi:hypothetical protein